MQLSLIIVFAALLHLVCSFQSRDINLHIISNSKYSCRSVLNPSNCDDNKDFEWEIELQEEASSVLLPVFYPEQSDTSSKTLTAEIALKRLLRKKYSHRQQNDESDRTLHNNKSMDESRGRLAELVLGTSVMRLRHFVAIAGAACNNSALPLPHPLNYTDISPLFTDKQEIGSASCSLEQKLHICRFMVREHANYIVSKDSSTLDSSIQLLLGCRDNPALILAIEHSIPIFLASSLLSQYGYDAAEKMCSLMNKAGPITIRKNVIKFTGADEDLCQWLMDNDGVDASPMRRHLNFQHKNSLGYNLDDLRLRKSNGRLIEQLTIPSGCISINPPTDSKGRKKLPKSIWSMTSYQNGYFEVQDAGSQCIVQALDFVPPSMGESTSVLDYCAGNGGKTFAIVSSLFDGKRVSENSKSDTEAVANVFSHDVVDERLRQIKGSQSRVGFDIDISSGIAEYKLDNTKCTLQTVSPSELDELRDSDTLFDTVLVDAPCSSSGVLRRRPSQRWMMTKQDTLQSLPSLQLEIIENAATFVEDGGSLVYATCSLLEEENEEVIKKFEKSEVYRNRGFFPWPFENDGESIEDYLRGHERTLLPSEWNDGFFFARYKRVNL